MIGAYVASMVVTLVQYLRLRDRRLLALLALFAFQALALTRDWWDYKKEVFQTAACASGLVLLLMLTMRRPPTPPGEPPPPA
jgi:peptidoglycan/LPS O-acetylase OafA/YrhL